MSERTFFRTAILPKEVLIIAEQRARKIYLLPCSRRKLDELLEAARHTRSDQSI